MILWSSFIGFVILALILDLGVFHRHPHVIRTREAALWSGVWVSCAMIFTGVIYLAFENEWIENPTDQTSREAVVKYVTGYLIELSLSVDNIFVIALIFSSFRIPRKYQHEVLFYGVLGAIVFRAVMIVFGVALINRFDWIIYVFGGFLLLTAIRMLFSNNEEFDPKTSKTFRWINHLYPVTHEVESNRFFIRQNGIKHATPLLVALIIIELTDIFFAVDSIPAILAITADPFIIFSSNILAVMGLRSMFFLISDMLDRFTYISYSLVAILAFVGIKMILSHHVDLPEWLSLCVILIALLAGIIASSFLHKNEK